MDEELDTTQQELWRGRNCGGEWIGQAVMPCDSGIAQNLMTMRPLFEPSARWYEQRQVISSQSDCMSGYSLSPSDTATLSARRAAPRSLTNYTIISRKILKGKVKCQTMRR